VRLVLPEQPRRRLHDREFLLEITDALASCTQLNALGRRATGKVAPVDTVLTDPVAQTAGADTEVICDIDNAATRPHQRDSTRSKLSRVGLRHDQSLSVQALITTARVVTIP
jgi:hypothetical protein